MHADENRSERDLVRAVLAGERAAFDAFYERWFPRVYGFLAQRCSKARAEELTRRVFRELLAELSDLPHDAALGAVVLARLQALTQPGGSVASGQSCAVVRGAWAASR